MLKKASTKLSFFLLSMDVKSTQKSITKGYYAKKGTFRRKKYKSNYRFMMLIKFSFLGVEYFRAIQAQNRNFSSTFKSTFLDVDVCLETCNSTLKKAVFM